MTDNEIIKALECCTKGNTSDVCVDCPLRTTDICTEEENGVLKLALDLINRKNTEIEGLLHSVQSLSGHLSSARVEAVSEFVKELHKRFLFCGMHSNGEINEIIKDVLKDFFKRKGG